MPLVLTMAMRAVTPSETTRPHCLTSQTNHSTSPQPKFKAKCEGLRQSKNRNISTATKTNK
jgi:hypothetical protein